MLDGVAAQRAAEQAVDLQIEGLEDLGEAVPDGRPDQQPAVAVAPRRIGRDQQARSRGWTSPGRRRTGMRLPAPARSVAYQ